jgi:tetratricopeptide (TPR) repeat protein
LQRHEEAEANFRLAIDTDISYWASFNAMGNFLFSQGRFLEAAEFYQMFINRADDDATALNNLGAAYYLAGDFRGAAEAWDRSLEIKPTRGAYSNTGSMYFYLGEFDKAADRYAVAANLAPNDYRMWGNLADAYSYTDDMKSAAGVAYKRAIRLGEEKLGVNAEDAQIISDVAFYYSRTGKREKALEMNAQAVSGAPDDMYVHYNSALIHAQFEESDDALTALERAVELEYQRELLPIDPAFADLKHEERFKRLIADNR